MSKSAIIANITWNPSGWRNIYVNPKAGHKYAQENPGHESLNFEFNKRIDKDGMVHGYVQWNYPGPKDFQSGGTIVFYSRNLTTNQGEIVGIYGSAEVLREPISTHYPGFKKPKDKLLSNIIAKKHFSMLFPTPLNEKKYKKMLNAKRLVPQSGFRKVKDINIVKHIIRDEVATLKRSGGIRQDELKKLASIYQHVTGEVYKESLYIEDDDIEEQDEISEVLQKKYQRDEIAQDLRNLQPTGPEIIEFEGKTYKRDNLIIAKLKFYRGSKCQICGTQIKKKDGGFYVEGTHIMPKAKGGREEPKNILILCPNHHKEFDLGKREIISHKEDNIRFKLNDVEYSIDLSIDDE